MRSLVARVQHLAIGFAGDSLLRNAVYLMASTAIMAVLGFAFWVFVARLYSPADIGVASAVIASTLLISNISMLGLNSGLIRFLPGSKDQNRDINGALLWVGFASLAAGAVYIVATGLLGPGVPFFGSRPWSWPLLLIIFASVTLNTLTDAVFIANRRAEYHLIVYSAFGLTRLLLPLVLVSQGELGIVLAYAGAVMISLLLSLYFMVKACGYQVWSRPNWGILLNTRRYALGNYLSAFISGLPQQLMPTIIIAGLGATSAAYFSLALTMANLLFIIPTSVGQSLLAEGSHRAHYIQRNVKRAAVILTVSLIPLIALAVVAARAVLSLFGPAYANGSVVIFQLLSMATVFVAINSIAATLLNLQHRPMTAVVVQGIIAVVTLGLTYAWMGSGLPGIGMAMVVGFGAGSVAYVAVFAQSAWRSRRLVLGRL